uniref:Long-chain neurotoxin isoform 1 n=1 Tax=Suta nigriceps TaxID=687874 RepID=H8PG67_9SAUR|nr:long-chain neurotoxin isoform 1 [Parasuta nigriceps]
MKTLLLTLVVVTIVRLDLGYTLTCYTSLNRESKTCPSGQNLCVTKTWCGEMCSIRGKRVELGCAATCPIRTPGLDFTVCTTDNCNPVPEREEISMLLSSILDHP